MKDNVIMKKIFAIVLFCAVCVMLHAQDAVHFEFSDGVEDAVLKSKMEQHISALLTAINRAETKNSAIDYSGINIDGRATQNIGEVWKDVHFRIVDDDIVEHCHRVKNSSGAVIGYQVLNIAVEMKPSDNSYTGVRNPVVKVNLDLKGVITDFIFPPDLKRYLETVKEGERSKDAHNNGFAQNDRAAFGLKGNVTKVIQSEDYDVRVNYFGTEWITCNLEFSQSGKLVRVNGLKGGNKMDDKEGEYFAADYEEFKEATKDVPAGVFVFSETPEYGLVRDANGRIWKRVHLVIGCEDDLEEWETLQYDDKGRVVSIKMTERSFYEKKFTDRGDNIRYSYDEDGNVIKAERYDSYEKKTYTMTYQYKQFDRAGNWLVRVANCEQMGLENRIEKRTVEY